MNRFVGDLVPRLTAAAALATLLVFNGTPQAAADDQVEAWQDIAETYGMVPGFFRLFPSENIANAWEAFKAHQLNPDIAMDAKVRELVSVAVAVQGSCTSCVYFHAAAALANGASMEEIAEAAGIGAATRELDSAIAEAKPDIDAFRHETKLVLWGDVRTIEFRGPTDDLCAFVLAAAATDTVRCD